MKYIYPQNILITLYKSLFVPHINYGSLLWGHAGGALDKIQKKAVRTITYSNYIAHSEPLLKELNLLKIRFILMIQSYYNINNAKTLRYINVCIWSTYEGRSTLYCAFKSCISCIFTVDSRILIRILCTRIRIRVRIHWKLGWIRIRIRILAK